MPGTCTPARPAPGIPGLGPGSAPAGRTARTCPPGSVPAQGRRGRPGPAPGRLLRGWSCRSPGGSGARPAGRPDVLVDVEYVVLVVPLFYPRAPLIVAGV